MKESLTLVLEWPDKRLHAHNKGGWRGKSALVKTLRQLAADTTRVLMHRHNIRAGEWTSGVAHYRFYVPDNRERDVVNMLQTMKPAIDGACAAPPARAPSAHLLTADCWQVLRLGHVHVEIDRENPRVEIQFVRTFDE